MNEHDVLKLIVKEYYETQKYRVRLGNRLKLKKDGDYQKTAEDTQGNPVTSIEEFIFLDDSYNSALIREKRMEKLIHKRLRDFPINEWFKDVKGVGDMTAAILISTIDIEKATTVSKIWQYCGLNPGNVRGMKKMSPAEAKKNGYEIVREYENFKGKSEVIAKTNDLIRGDKLKAGYLAPYNQWIRTKLIGVLASGFLKAKSPYAKLYYDYKHRLESKNTMLPAAEQIKKGHIHNRAMRYMVKTFLADMYAVWRELEGLEVRPPYQEEKLGHKHTA